MSVPFARPAFALAAVLTVAGCTSYDHGRGYGYSSASIGYYDGGYYDGDYYGWSGDYYYPGNGYYLYDRSGGRHRWDDRQRHYWEGRRGRDHNRGDNWSGYHDNDGRDYRRDHDRRDDDRHDRRHR